MIYFPRLLDKIRRHLAGQLPDDYGPNLGAGFDKRCCDFWRVHYEDVVARVAAGSTDAEVLAWCREHGRPLDDHDLFVWNEFLRKCGWQDDYSERLRTRLESMGLTGREDIRTLFDLIEVDEGRVPGGTGAIGE